MDLKLEVIGFTIDSCIIAQNAGADRIELCDGPAEGGTTPSYGFIKSARKKLSIELFPIIRPRGGDFLYSDDEFNIMVADTRVCKELGCDGIVIGMLNADGTVDKDRCRILTDLAYPMGVTFHRAFDRAVDPVQAMEDIIDCGFERILTSGQKPNAMDGIALLAELVKLGEGRISIMPGSGVRSDNIIDIAQKSGATEFHTSARMMRDTKMKFTNELMNEELRSVITDEQELKKIKDILQGL